jgi:hypothetical protein
VILQPTQILPCPPTQTPLFARVLSHPPFCPLSYSPLNVYYADGSRRDPTLSLVREHAEGTGRVTLLSLSTGFDIASIVRDLHSDAYRLLSTILIPAHLAGESGVLYLPIHRLEHDAVGNLLAVRWKTDDRSTLRDVPHARTSHICTRLCVRGTNSSLPRTGYYRRYDFLVAFIPHLLPPRLRAFFFLSILPFTDTPNFIPLWVCVHRSRRVLLANGRSE